MKCVLQNDWYGSGMVAIYYVLFQEGGVLEKHMLFTLVKMAKTREDPLGVCCKFLFYFEWSCLRA